MAFDDAQVRKLRARLSSRHIKSREGDRQTLNYIEGWHAVAEANRIFGFDGWCRETVASECVWRQPQGNRFAAAYLARVRITVRAGGEEIVREGSGAGEAIADTPGQAHEMASKAAETDATKRALSTFGNPFGLSLYAGPAEKTEQTRRKSANADNCFLKKKDIYNGVRLKKYSHSRLMGVIDKKMLPLSEPRRVRNKDHLKFVASRPCLICDRRPSQAHHVKFAQPSAMGRKVSDEFTVPLCAGHHRELHAFGDERKWWKTRDIDPLAIAQKLWAMSRGLDNAAE
jgi:hypothetical protein